VDNYTEETKPLFRLLETESFQFIIIRINHESIKQKLVSDIRERFPERKSIVVEPESTDYREFVDQFYNLKRGFYFVNHFEELVNKSELYTGLNLRRDKLAMYPIAIICFVSPWFTDLFARAIMDKMPDLWSFRSLILDLKKEVEKPVTHYHDFISINPLFESVRLSIKHQSNSEVEDSFATKFTLLPILDNSIISSGKYNTALQILQEQLNELSEDLNGWRGSKRITTLKHATGEFNESIILGKHLLRYASSYYESDKNNLILGLDYVYELINLGNINMSMLYFEEAHKLYIESVSITKNINLTDGKLSYFLSHCQSKLGMIYIEMNQIDKAFNYLIAAQKNILNYRIFDPMGTDVNIRLALIYGLLGLSYTKKNDQKLAFDSYMNFYSLSIETINFYPDDIELNLCYALANAKLGDGYINFGAYDKAEPLYQKNHDISLMFYEKFEQDVNFKNIYAISLNRLGNLYAHGFNNLQKGLEYLKKAKSIWQLLVEKVPESPLFQKQLELITITINTIKNQSSHTD
jgi:tetratricopeptide (TPR) repeat protein